MKPMNKKHKGKVSSWFADSDKDGVANVFDCSPHNRKKQEVMIPRNFDGGGMQEMYARMEYGRQQKSYEQQLKQAQKEAEEAQKKWEADQLKYYQSLQKKSSSRSSSSSGEYKGQPGSSMVGKVTFGGKPAIGTGTKEDPFRAPGTSKPAKVIGTTSVSFKTK